MLSRWQQRLRWPRHWSFARRYIIRTIYVYNLPRLHTFNIKRSSKRKWFHTKKARSRQYPTETMIDADYAEDLVLFINATTQAKFLLYSIQQVTGGIGLFMNANKTEFMCLEQEGAISTISGKPLKLVDQFSKVGDCSQGLPNSHTSVAIVKVWTAIDRLSLTWKSNFSNKIKHDFFQLVAISILLCWCTTWTLTKHMEKKLDGNYTRMLRAILKKYGKHHTTKQQLYGHLPPISQTIQLRLTRHAGRGWRIKDKLISDVLFWGLLHKATPVLDDYQLYEDIGCSLEDLWMTELDDKREGFQCCQPDLIIYIDIYTHTHTHTHIHTYIYVHIQMWKK